MDKETLRFDAARAYVLGDTSEPVVLSAFHGASAEERTEVFSLHRGELEAIDASRLAILESMLLPFEKRSR